jgi:hypothetical protein
VVSGIWRGRSALPSARTSGASVKDRPHKVRFPSVADIGLSYKRDPVPGCEAQSFRGLWFR